MTQTPTHTQILDAPVPFDGTTEERQQNFNTHAFGEEGRCYFCDCRPWGITAFWPCGTEPPRAPMSEAEYEVRTGGYGAMLR